MPLSLSTRHHRKEPAYPLWIVPLGADRLSGGAQPLPCLSQDSTGGAPPHPLCPSPSLPRDRRRASLLGTSLPHGSLPHQRSRSLEMPRPVVHSCKILTPCDTSAHGGFSVLWRHANEGLLPLWTCRCRH